MIITLVRILLLTQRGIGFAVGNADKQKKNGMKEEEIYE